MKNLAGLVTTNNPVWFKKWFDSSFYHQLYANRDEKEAANFIDRLLSELQPSPNSRMLDLGCGMGRHSKFLASKGFSVTGLDLASSSIRSAKKFETSSLQFYQHDMRLPFGKNYFDFVFNFFTSFGYFGSEAENHNVIRNISNALKRGGMIMMDYLNVSYSEERMVSKEEREIDGIDYHISRWMDDKHFYKKIVIDAIQAEGPFEYTEQVAKLYKHDFDYMFDCHGLRLQKVYGDYWLNEYDANASPRLILVAEKK